MSQESRDAFRRSRRQQVSDALRVFKKQWRRRGTERMVARPALQGWMSKRRFRNNKLLPNAVKWRRSLRGRRAGHVKRDLGVILINDMKSFSQRLRKVLWTVGVDRDLDGDRQSNNSAGQATCHVHESHQTHYCLSAAAVILTLPLLCPSPKSTQIINPATMGTRFSKIQIFQRGQIWEA